MRVSLSRAYMPRSEWPGHNGFAKFSNLLSGSKYKFDDPDQAIVAWMKNVTGQYSKVSIRCSECDVMAHLVIKSFAKNRTAACLCNGNAPINSEQYFGKFLATLQTSRLELVDISTFDDWKGCMAKNRPRTSLRVRCIDCGVTDYAGLGTLSNKGSGLRCKCKGMPMVTRFDEMCKQYADAGMSLVYPSSAEEWTTHVKSKSSFVKLRCNACGVESESRVERRPDARLSCFCTGNMPYSCETKFHQLLAYLAQGRFSWVDAPTYFDWQGCNPTKHSRICLRCNVCELSVNPTVDKVVQGKVGCLCANSGELMVGDEIGSFLDLTNSKLCRQKQFDGLVGVGNGNLSYDFCIETCSGTPLVLIEVDGGHHFGGGHAHWKGDRDHTLEHDLRKERFACTIGATVLRLEVRTVTTEKANWREWLRSKVDEAIRFPQSAIHCISHGNQYVSSPYSDLRVQSVSRFE